MFSLPWLQELPETNEVRQFEIQVDIFYPHLFSSLNT